MSHVSYLLAGYGVTIVGLAAYASWVLRRRRALLDNVLLGPGLSGPGSSGPGSSGAESSAGAGKALEAE
ncbi:MAG: hypothetical protein ACT4OS_07295 [Acidimicrobiales bacterium]